MTNDEIAALGFEQDMIGVRQRLRNTRMVLGDGFVLRDGMLRLADLLVSQPSISRDEFKDAFKEYF